MRRVRNIAENRRVSLVVDSYSENWQRLRYVIIDGLASMLYTGAEYKRAISLLRRKYRQYRSMRLEERPIIRLSLFVQELGGPVHAGFDRFERSKNLFTIWLSAVENHAWRQR